nr:VWA domain-containing protein [uncultured Blautia sp.]
MKQKLPGRLLSLMCALILVLSTVFLDLGHVSRAYAFGDEFALETEEGDIQDAGIEAQVMDIEDDQSEISTELSDDTYEDPDEITTEADDAGMADFSSGENLTEQDLEVEDSAEDISEDPQPLTFRKLINNDTVEVIAEAPAGALPEGTELVVKEIKNNTDDAEMTEQYNRLSARITEQLQNQGKNLDGFLPYNISFTDMDGNPVKPSEKVTYSFHYTEAAAPELTDPSASTVTAAQLKENKETAQLDMTELKAEENKLSLETNESRQLQRAAFQAADNAVYTFIWSSTPTADNNGEADNEETQEPESEPTQIGTIRLLVDEVNLRTAPSMEADVIGTADAGTELPLLEIITAEDGSTWYKVSYSDTVVYVSGEVAEVVEANGEDQDEEPTEEAQLLTFKKLINNDTVEVLAEAPAGALPDGAELSVKPITNNTEDAEEAQQYAEIEGRLLQQAESNEQDLCGFLAYDISFVDAEGQKIEPSAEIKISMNYMKTAVPESMTDTAEVNIENEDTPEAGNSDQTPTIEVLHFVENQNGEVQNIVNMTQEGQASVKTTNDGQIQNAEFNTGSFSVFTITWTQIRQGLNGETEVGIECVDTNGNAINVSELSKVRTTKDTVIRLSDYEPYISGYGFVKAQIGGNKYADNYAELKLIKAVQNNSAWTYSYLNDTSYTADTEWTPWTSETPTVYLVYTPTELSIQDDLTGTGNLIPVLSNSMKTLVANAKEEGNEVSYIWEKSINNGDFQAVNKVKVSGDNYNITTNEDGVDCLNVALDKGALSSSQSSVKYKVSIKIGDERKGTSGEYSVRYYKELYNGDFEIPVVAQDHPNTSNWQYSNENYKAQGGVWQTTGTKDNNPPYCDTDGADIEIVTTATNDLSGYNWYGTVCDADGDAGQFAELNCQAAGALYQDVITYSGEKLSFYLSHRARGGNTSTKEHDTMYVVMMPTSSAEGCVTQEDLEKLIKRYLPNFNINQSYSKEDKENLYNKDGVCIERVTSDDQDWHYVEETQKYTATSNMTRFFFVAGKTATGVNTVGNFLDNVGFGQNLPPANPGTFTLKVEKKVVGLEPSAVLKHNMQFNIKAYNQDGSEATNAPLNREHFSLNDMTYDEDGHVYSKLFTNQNIDANTKYIYEVVETGATADAYTLETTQDVSGGELQTDPDKVSTLVGERDSVTFKITNTYTLESIDSIMQYNKTAKVDDWDKRTYDINITASSKLTSSSATTSKDKVADIMMVLDTSGSMLYNNSNSDARGFEYKGVFKDIQSTLDTSKVYYYGDDTRNVQYLNYYNYYNAKSPMIYLGGEWMYFDGSGWNKVSLTSTKEIYTIDSRLTGLKEASKTFISSTAASSRNSRIGLVTFASDSKLVTGLSKVESSKDSLIKSVSSIYASGGTKPSKGLSTAWNQLKEKKDVPRYVILFTDGAPDDDDRATAKSMADSLKEDEVTIYTIGLNVDGTWLKDSIASEGCDFDANSIDSLKDIFKQIQETITQSGDIADAEITDVIDPRFELLEVGGVAITAEQIAKLKNKESIEVNGATVSMTKNGNYQVKWTGQTIPEASKGTWNKTIKVRAKDGYIGGNAVPTNVKDDSKIHTGYGDAVLPQPTVNVKSDLLVNNKEVKIFYGDTVPTDEDGDIVKALFDKAHPKGNVTQLDGTSNPVEYTMGANGEVINQQDFTLEWYRDQKCEEKDKITDWSQEKPTPGSTKYYLKVTYNTLGNATEQSNANTTTEDGKPHVAGEGGKVTAHNSVADQTRPYGVYTVNVIAGQIQITKKLEEAPESTQEFKFLVTKDEDNTFEQKLSISVGADGVEGVSRQLSDLERGTYRVKEVLPANSEYEVASAAIGTATNCENVGPETSAYVATFKLGYKKNQTNENVITAEYTYDKSSGGTVGAVEYTNREIKTNLDLKKIAADTETRLTGAKFKLEKSDNNGGWTSVKTNYDDFTVLNGDDQVELTNLTSGVYRLTEITAPTGYMVLSSEIQFSVTQGKVTLTNAQGTASNMWELSTDTTKPPVLTIKNQKVYSLPEAGGSGIYWYMIGGMLLMVTSAWILYKNKCKEVLGK